MNMPYPAPRNPGNPDREHVRLFEAQRAAMLALAWRMLGSRADAQDLVQTLWLQWQEVDLAGLHEPAAYLTRMATNACIDRLRNAQRQREHYVGVWLPEPWIEHANADAGGAHELADPQARLAYAQDVSTAFLLTLERLTPLERAAFLLHDVFALSFDDIARRLGRDPATCRQLATRARRHVQQDYARCEVSHEQLQALLQAFEQALQAGDPEALAAVLCADATLMSDGGGRMAAIARPIQGADAVALVLCGLHRAWLRQSPSGRLLRARVNGGPGYVLREPDGRIALAVALEPDASARIAGVYMVRNPDKLRASL